MSPRALADRLQPGCSGVGRHATVRQARPVRVVRLTVADCIAGEHVGRRSLAVGGGEVRGEAVAAGCAPREAPCAIGAAEVVARLAPGDRQVLELEAGRGQRLFERRLQRTQVRSRSRRKRARARSRVGPIEPIGMSSRDESCS